MGFFRYDSSYQANETSMKKVLITGGCGAVGSAFIKEFYSRYQFFSLSRNQEKQALLREKFNSVALLSGSIEDKESVVETFQTITPDIVIHTAALKYIEICEKNPIQAIKTNVLGSLNIIEASQAANVSITVGISSDKACQNNNVYGQTKHLMEKMFFEANNAKSRFVCCRLSNVAGSEKSVIPIWLSLLQKKQPLKITDHNMNRFMMLPSEVAQLIQTAIDKTQTEPEAFTLLKKLKSVNLLSLAQCLSSQIDIIGKRAGENLNETLVSENELPRTYLDHDYIMIKSRENPVEKNQLAQELSTMLAEKMNVSEMQNVIGAVKAMYENIN